MAATFDFYKLRHDEFIIKNVHFVSDDKFKTIKSVYFSTCEKSKEFFNQLKKAAKEFNIPSSVYYDSGDLTELNFNHYKNAAIVRLKNSINLGLGDVRIQFVLNKETKAIELNLISALFWVIKWKTKIKLTIEDSTPMKDLITIFLR